MAQFPFDASKVAPQGDRSPVPEGQYSVVLVGSDIKATANNKGRMLTLQERITDGPLSGQIIMETINIQHENPVATQIGQERLSALCHAVGVLQIQDTAQLHGRPHQIKVTVTTDGKTPPKSYNDIVAFLKPDGSAVTGGAAQTAAAPAWAGAAAPTSAPAGAPAPTPAPVAAPTPAPVAAAAPVAAPTPVNPDLYYVAVNGQTNPTPMTADQIRALPMGLAAVQVNKVGAPDWQPGTTLAIQTPVAAAAASGTPASAALPPWMHQQPPAA